MEKWPNHELHQNIVESQSHKKKTNPNHAIMQIPGGSSDPPFAQNMPVFYFLLTNKLFFNDIGLWLFPERDSW